MVCSECRKLERLVQCSATHCPVKCATMSTWTNDTEHQITNSLICVSFTFYSICKLPCFVLFYLQMLDCANHVTSVIPAIQDPKFKNKRH
jgi:hypothetical protein